MELTLASIRTGLKHRLICALPPLMVAAAVTMSVSDPLDAQRLGLVQSAVIVAMLMFASPLILTEGFSRPMPSSQHLSLISVRVQKALLGLAIAAYCLPIIVMRLP